MRPFFGLPVIFVLAACGSSSPTGSTSGGGGGSMPPPSGSIVDVSAHDYSFTQPSITVSVGTTVRWTNAGPSEHTATSDGSVWDSGTMSAPTSGGGYGGSTSGGSYSFKFAAAGTYPYHCKFHESLGMRGTITVK